jgi:hypothetical protein
MASNKEIRNFKLEYDNKIYSSYLKGRDSRQAANKGFSKLVKSLGDSYVLGENIMFNIIDSANNVSKPYIGSRKLLDTPHVVKIGDKVIEYKYANKINLA